MIYHRKTPRLSGYDYSNKGAYFITICVKERVEILGEVLQHGDERKMQLSEYGLVIEKYLSQIKGIDAYVIMPNHIHMIIFINNQNEQPITRRIATFKTLVTKELGFAIFQRSFHDHIIRNEQEYLHIVNYIVDNPQKWTQDCFCRNDTANNKL